jgi:hypothetical protein
MKTDTLPDAASRPAGSAAPLGVTAEAGPGDGTGEPGWWRRMWRRLLPPPGAELVLDQLNRQLAVLEGARAELEAGWVQGGWWAVSSADGSPRLVTGYAAASGTPDHVDGVCLVGALVRAGSSLPDAAFDVGRAVDAVYDTLWASRGQPDLPRASGLPPVPPPDVRLARVRAVTQWNDQAGRTREEVMAVVDGAISVTIMDLMSAPRPTPAGPAAVPQTARTG